MKIDNLNITNLVVFSFDDASNMSGADGGVQALLRQISPGLLFVHCRSHVLHLALVKAASTVPAIKRTLNMLNKPYTLFHGSRKRLLMLKETLMALDGVNHKLVQPGETRWLSYEGSVAMVCCHYASICVALGAIYVEAGIMSRDAGGILFTMRADSTLFYLHVFVNIPAAISET